jgi:hypothetical protein
MAMKLFLDDNRPVPEGWRPARTAEAAKVYLMGHKVDNMSLDFDLDAPECQNCNFNCGLREGGCRLGCQCHKQGAENGMDLLHWMRDTGNWPRNRPTIHSANLDGALRMKAFVLRHYPGS